ncbi:hypothetical protein OJ997_22645 [Solirubrobacter phytolaccae]|uniref:GWxTD domain-containing protein n=1 Tax=Solirubrobacter phytolaccae TaxID=1404360 RepID=A0A9X3SB15_9ACTN|nr:hypothetical protein [Solirubrobacter phytolaccae]MDA0183126.1 hypothetical protein [Solirubrobacter phytolaccae]
MPRLLLAVLIMLVVPASAQARACLVTGPEERAEQTLRDEIRVRDAHGFRQDRAYVAKLIAAGPPSRRHGIRVTKAEDRYLDLRNRLGVGAKVGRYMRARPEINAFWEVKDDWPRGPYMAVFVAGDPAAHRAAILRRASYPRHTRVVRVRYSYDAKDRIQKRIQDDDKALARAGFEVVGSDTDWGLDRIDVEVITKRKDAVRYFARRYGSVVRARPRTSKTFERCTTASGYEIAPDGMSVTVSWTDAPEKPVRVELTERGDRVAIGIVSAFSVYPGFGDSGGKAVVRLSAPLGDRPVIDAANGVRLVQTGPSPGAPPCPVRPVRTPLESLIRERAEQGMNADPAFVQTLIDAEQRYTPEEQRWRDEVQKVDFDRDVHDYVFGGRVYPDWGGTTLVARYPEPPYLIVRFIRRFAFHVRELEKLTDAPIRFERSTVPRDWFDALAQYIGDDARAGDGYLEDFYVTQAEQGESEQVVHVYVITRRTQAEADAYFKGRYGGIVRVHIIGDRVECRGGYSTR